jgi:16S rRNA (guanine527-N7)-methyltransferase
MDAADRSSLPRRPSSDSPTPTERTALPRTVEGLPDLPPEFAATLDAGLRALGLELPAATRHAIEAHVRLLLAWNEHMNLSGLRTADEIARGHVLDALLAVPALRTLSGAQRPPTLIDLGSGGGFPGLPLALALPARRAALVDSITKKAAFLDAAAAVADVAGTEIVALAERAEDLADEPDQREGWDLVTARAVGTVAEVAELGLPLARRGGHVVMWKRASTDLQRAQLEEELGRARRIIQAAGGARPRIVGLDAAPAVGLAGNCLVTIRKVRPTPDRYPRSPGERRRTALA